MIELWRGITFTVMKCIWTGHQLTLKLFPDLMKFFSRILSRAGSSSSYTSSMRSGRPMERQSSRWERKNLWLSDVALKRGHILTDGQHIPHKKNQNVKFAQISCKPWRTCKKLDFSFSLIQVFPWVCGSMRSGYLEALVTMMPFCTDRSSPGSPWRFHSLILNTN